MKKEDLRAALHRVQPEEALIRRTLDEIHARQEAKAHRGLSRAFGYRLAGAVCALALVIGLGAMAANFSGTQSPGTPEQRAQPNELVAAQAGYSSAGTAAYSGNPEAVPADAAAEQLRGQLQPGWMLLQGSLQDIYFRSVSEEGSLCAVSIHVTKVWESGENGPKQDEVIVATICFTDAAEMEGFADAIGSELCFLWAPGDDAETPRIVDYRLCQ